MRNNFPPISKIRSITDSFIAELTADGKKPVCVAICDKHGFLCYFARMDNAPARCVAISCRKAYTSAIMECSTISFHERLRDENLVMEDFCDSRLTSMAGGRPLIIDGLIEGGIGISGRKISEDDALALRLAALLR